MSAVGGNPHGEPDVVGEFDAGAFKVRIVQGSGAFGNPIRGLVATDPEHEFLRRLWLGVGWADEQTDEGWVRASMEHEGRAVAVRHGLAMFGMPWSMVSLVRLDRQMYLWNEQPEWMERWEADDLCALRTHLFGDPMVKVPRALSHCREYARNLGGSSGELDWLR